MNSCIYYNSDKSHIYTQISWAITPQLIGILVHAIQHDVSHLDSRRLSIPIILYPCNDISNYVPKYSTRASVRRRRKLDRVHLPCTSSSSRVCTSHNIHKIAQVMYQITQVPFPSSNDEFHAPDADGARLLSASLRSKCA